MVIPAFSPTHLAFHPFLSERVHIPFPVSRLPSVSQMDSPTVRRDLPVALRVLR